VYHSKNPYLTPFDKESAGYFIPLFTCQATNHTVLDSLISHLRRHRFFNIFHIMTGNTYTPGQASLPTPNSTKSFWHSQPSKTLIGHRTTSCLPTKADIVIIGSGISGASAAYHLHEEHYDKSPNVVMLEAREACWGATGRVSVPPFAYFPF
jgi:hypothetical protein